MSDPIDLKKRLTRRQFVQGLGLGTVTAIVLASCTKENDHYVVKIDQQNYYDPAKLVIPVGTTVTWQNISLFPQSVTCDPTKAQNSAHVLLPKNAEAWDSGRLYPGQMWSHTFETPGNYVYFSKAQESDSLLGTLTVTG